ncbi:WLM domain-containing protein [Xylariales sp. AK1849]|nr:WLM domain-containing protein [Xylariales sp. AK1849]
MPIGIQRLNAKKSQPNSLIIFIKPLKDPDEAIAQDFLERIAAQCLPIMKEHHLSVMSLEEYEPNREFVGRNFNAGEVVQLVLKSPSTGRWLPFNYVQMVMMHELAHCKQMNHSKAFWAVRNSYAEQMRTLWSRGYSGEGLWGRGALLTTGQFETNTVRPDEMLPEHLCGGTYRSRRRKRKQKDQPSYQERKQRRILKKFGANGVALGEDEDVKAELEKGRRTRSKPRVADSKRGRELRAAAALARFGQAKKAKEDEKKAVKVEDDDETASEEESETASESDDEATEATGIDGKRLLDVKGKRMVRVCEDENPNDADAQGELRELQASMTSRKPLKPDLTLPAKPLAEKQKGQHTGEEPIRSVPDKPARSTSYNGVGTSTTKSSKVKPMSRPKPRTMEGNGEAMPQDITNTQSCKTTSPPSHDEVKRPTESHPHVGSEAGVGVCPMCSFENGPVCLICGACSNVLVASKDPKSWRCKNASCKESRYLNAGDSGACGICGERKLAYQDS